MQLCVLRCRISGQLRKLLAGTNADLLAAVRALPDVQRSSPVAVTGNCPVLNVLQPVSEAPLSHGRRNPVDFLVVAHKVITNLGHLDEPGLTCIINQRCSASPAVRIVMLNLRSRKKDSSLIKILQDLRITADSTFLDLCFGRLAAHARKLSRLRLHAAVVIHHLDKRCVVFAAHAGIVFTKCRCNMNDTGTIGHRDIVIAVYEECLLMLAVRAVLCALIQGLVFPVLQITSLIGLKNLIGRLSFFCKTSQNLICQRLCKIIGITVSGLYLNIGVFRIHAERDVGGKRPGSCRPRKEISILGSRLKAHNCRAVLQGFIALRHLMRGKRCSAARAVRNYLEALIQKILVPDLLQCPPFGLNIIIIIGNIGMIHVCPEADLTGELLPHSLIFPHRLLALFDKRLDAVCFNLILAFDSDFLFNFQLNRKAVRIPACLSRNLLSLHRMITGNHILNDTGLHMSDMRLAVCSRRSVIEHINGMSLILSNALVEDVIVLPELRRFLLTLNEIQVGVYLVVHNTSFADLSRQSAERNIGLIASAEPNKL